MCCGASVAVTYSIFNSSTSQRIASFMITALFQANIFSCVMYYNNNIIMLHIVHFSIVPCCVASGVCSVLDLSCETYDLFVGQRHAFCSHVCASAYLDAPGAARASAAVTAPTGAGYQGMRRPQS